MGLIASVSGRTINDSRGQATVEVTVSDDKGNLATASLPLGSSIGKYEAKVVDAESAVTAINTTVAPALLRMSLDSQEAIDQKLKSLDPDGTMGVNSLLGVSLACARLIAQAKNIFLYQHIQSISESPGFTLPTPMFNLINGGKHANNNLDFQEYMIIPLSMLTFHEKLAAGKKIFMSLGQILADAGHDTQIGYEGGFAPNLSTNEEGLGLLKQAIQAAGYVPGADVYLGLDVAASALASTYVASTDSYMDLFEDFPLFSMEDPFPEDDWDNWAALKKQVDQLASPTQARLIVGDDLFVANKERLVTGIQKFVANAMLIKINQASTLTETLETIDLARKYNYVHILSNRSGETLDSFISDLAVGSAAAFIKSGAPNDQAPERITKYERIVQIEEELHSQS